MFRVVCAAGLVLCSVGSLCAQGDAGDAEGRFFDGLRARGLFSLAESYALDRLADAALSPTDRAQVVLELSRIYVARAGQTVGESQRDDWTRAAETAADGARDFRETRWGAELLLQTAIVPLERARFDREESRLFLRTDPRDGEVQAGLRDALRSLQEVLKDLDRESKQVANEYRQYPDRISPFQHRSVQRLAEHLIARTMLEIVELEFPEPSRRGAPIRAVQDQLKSLVAGADDERVTWDSRLLHLRTLRLLGDRDAFSKYVDRELKEIPGFALDGLREEQARLQLALGRADEAAALLFEHRRQSGPLRGPLALLSIQSQAGMWQTAHVAGDATLSADLLQSMRGEVVRAQRDAGGVWAWRAARYLEVMEEAQQYGFEIAESLRAAKGIYASGDAAAAAEAYGKLAQRCAAEGHADLAAETAYTHGSILLQLQRYREAGDVFFAMADDHRTHPRAAQTHLLWAYCLGKIYEQSPTQIHREKYTIALRAHLDRHRQGVTAGDAAIMLGQLEERRLQVTEAVRNYLLVADDHPKAGTAHRALVRCYNLVFARLRELNQPEDAWRIEAVAHLVSRVDAYARASQPLDLDRLRVITGVARWLLEPVTADFDRADRLLNQVILDVDRRIEMSQLPPADPALAEWQREKTIARQLRMVALASRGQMARAGELFDQLSGSDPEDLLNLLDGLSRIAAEVDARTARGIAELQLRTSQTLDARREQLSASQADRLDVCLAQAYEATEHQVEAIRQYDALVRRHPDRAEFRRELASLLMRCGSSDCLHRAHGHWSKLEAAAKQGTPEWFTARKEIVACLVGTGKTDEAAKLLRVTELLYPEFGGPPTQAGFLELKAKLRSRE